VLRRRSCLLTPSYQSAAGAFAAVVVRDELFSTSATRLFCIPPDTATLFFGQSSGTSVPDPGLTETSAVPTRYSASSVTLFFFLLATANPRGAASASDRRSLRTVSMSASSAIVSWAPGPPP